MKIIRTTILINLRQHMREREQESNDIDNLLKYADKQSQNGNGAANNKYTQKNYPGQNHRPRNRFPQKY